MRFQRILGTTLGAIALATLAACGGGDGRDGENGTDGSSGSNGSNGVSALLKITAEAPGTYCANGGSRIESGPDTNGNGALEAGEVTGTQYVCNGSTPVRTLTATAVEASGTHCAAGGTRITAGADANGNGTLDAAEISSTAYVCNGATGATGPTGGTGATGPTGGTGAAGANGFTQLMAMAVEPVGSASCTYGGTRITSGLDIDRDGTLAAAEITATSYVCNGSGVNWTNVVSDTNVQMASHMGYIASNTQSDVTFSLPAAPAIGDIVRMKGGLGAGWKITQTAGQSMDLGSLRTWSSLSGQSWSELPVYLGAQWESWVASSTDGRTVVALASWTTSMTLSKDGGATWNTITPPGTDLRQIGVSPDGQVIYASHFGAIGFNVSSDDGATWVQRSSMTDVQNFAVYANGVVAVGSVGGVIAPYRSTDGGLSWTSLVPPGAPTGVCWASVAASTDGQTLAIGGDGNGSCSAISTYVSQDAGASWVESDAVTGPPRNRHQFVAVSGSGNTVVVGSANGGIGLRVSTDGGRSYRQGTVATDAFPVLSGRVILSADGRRMMASGQGRVYVSNNTGYNWSFTPLARGVQAVAGSSTLESVYLSTPRGPDAGYVFKSTSVLSPYSGTTSGVTGQVSGSSGDALELQHLGAGVWSVLSGGGNTLVVR